MPSSFSSSFFLACSHHSLGTFLVSGNTKYSWLILYFLHPAVKSDFPSRNNGYFHWKKVFKNCVCSLLLIFLVRQAQELREISCTYIKTRQLISPVQDQRVQPHLSLFRILVVFSNNEKPGKIIEEMCAYFS